MIREIDDIERRLAPLKGFRHLVNPGIFVGAVLLQVNFELLPRALQFVFFPALLKIEIEVAADSRPELRLHVSESEDHAAEVRKIADRAAALERTHERDHAKDHDHVLGFDREKKT